jgi:ribonuclease Z
MHSTALQAARIAAKARAGSLITGHYSSRYKDLDAFLQEAQSVFPNTVLGLEGSVYELSR